MGSETKGGRWMKVVVHETSALAPSKSIQLVSVSQRMFSSLPLLACRMSFEKSLKYNINNTSVAHHKA